MFIHDQTPVHHVIDGPSPRIGLFPQPILQQFIQPHGNAFPIPNN
jgi:hypothetical protein